MPEEPLDTDVMLKPSDKYFSDTGLKLPSAVRLHRMTTISISIIKRELGVIPLALRHVIDKKLKKLFSLT